MNKHIARLILWLARYNVTATEYKARLTKKKIAPHGEPFKSSLDAIIEIEVPAAPDTNLPTE